MPKFPTAKIIIKNISIAAAPAKSYTEIIPGATIIKIRRKG